MDRETELPPGVAIVGLAARFPGAGSIEAFWANLCAGRESVTTFSADEVIADGVPPDLARDPAYVKARGLIEEPEAFDAAFFGISPREATLMDPQHRLFLETCWSALEHAGYAPASIPEVVGVWGGMSTGMSNDTYLHTNLGGPRALPETDVLPALLGNENDYLTTRVSYKLGLRGPSVNVQTACSTSLVAAVQAFQSLMTYGCDLALAGGVSVSYPQRSGYLYQEGGIGSPDGRCRAYDERAQGTVFGNGVGVVVLKRVDEAVADGDTIYAVIRGGATNNDGSAKVSFAAPSVEGQSEVIALAQAIADVEASSISYVEGHGTGTPIGDPIEVSALTRAFRRDTDETGFCALGSVKSNFGHLDSAAGVAGLIKTTLCLHHRRLVPTVHFERPNPRLELDTSPFFVNAETRPWETDRLPRRAGVSAFGIGGTNAHLVLEEAPGGKALPSASTRGVADASSIPAEGHVPAAAGGPELLVLSARTPEALSESAERLARALSSESAPALSDAAWTLQVGRESFRHRAAIVVADALGAEDAGALARLDPGRCHRGQLGDHPASLAFLFPGGGAQYVDMGRGLYETDEGFRASVDRGLRLLSELEGIDLRSVWFPDEVGRAEAAASFERPSLQLPALFILETALAAWWREAGFEPTALMGHSLGENTAACVAGVLDYADALRLVTLRGRLFEQVEKGGMLSVAATLDEIEPHLDDGVDVAAVNAPAQVTLSGPTEPLEEVRVRLEEAGLESQTVPIEIAAHSRMVEPILDDFRDFLAGVELRPPEIPIVSNRTGGWLTDTEATDPDYWTEHLRETVRFAEGVRTLAEDEGRVFLEVGPGRILGSLARLNVPGADRRVVPSMRHPRDDGRDEVVLQEAVGGLWIAGCEVEWERVRRGRRGRRVPLPTYPFQRRPYLVEPPEREASTGGSGGRGAPASQVGLVDPQAGVTLEEALDVQRRVTRAILELLEGGEAGSGSSGSAT